MDGMHDMGGRQGFGSVKIDDGNCAPFKADWEIIASAFMGRLVRNQVFNMDEYRHAIERMDARDYVAASYFERTFSSAATLCVEKGVITREEFNAVTGGRLPFARPAKAGRSQTADLPPIAVGDRVRVKDESVGGHMRMPGYIRGKTGVVVSASKPYPFPDASAHGLPSPKQRTFDVRFQAKDLWPNASDDAEVHVGVFHGYLERLA